MPSLLIIEGREFVTAAMTRSEYRATVTERDWQAQVLAIASAANWLTYHTHDSRRSTAGFPDLTLVRGPRMIFAELKTQKGRVTVEQQKWLDALGAASVEVYLWRPADVDEVVATLTQRGDSARSWWRP